MLSHKMNLHSHNDSPDEDSEDWTQSWDGAHTDTAISNDQLHADKAPGKFYC
jgi:hypothetical protein